MHDSLDGTMKNSNSRRRLSWRTFPRVGKNFIGWVEFSQRSMDTCSAASHNETAREQIKSTAFRVSGTALVHASWSILSG
jgi:hypothetical protein